MLSIDDSANQLVYGEGTTPRMIFEGRTRQQPDGRVVDFRDALEEASALARDRRRGDADAPRARVAARGATSATTSDGAQTQPLAPPSDEARPAPFEDVPADGGVRSEPLPPEPAEPLA